MRWQHLVYSFAVVVLVFVFHILNEASFAWSFVMAFSFFVLSFYSKKAIYEIYELFRKIFVITLIPGMIVWFLFLLGVSAKTMAIGLVPNGVVPNQLKVEAGFSYILFPGSVMLDYMQHWPVFRFQGLFDEPGVVGTSCALMLVAERFNLKRRLNVVMLFAGLMSVSLAFYVIVPIYVLLKFKKFWKFILISMTVLCIIASIPSPVSKILNERVFSKITSDTTVSGLNRMSQLDMAHWENWKKSSTAEFFTGLDTSISGSSGWRNVFIKSGFLGMLTMLFFYILLYVRRPPKMSFHVLSFLLIFFLSFLQRTAIVTPFYFFLFLFVVDGYMRPQCVNESEKSCF